MVAAVQSWLDGSGQQLWLAGIGRRNSYRNGEAVRYQGEREPTCSDHSIHRGTQSQAYSKASADAASEILIAH